MSNKRKHLAVFAFIVVLPALFYGAQFVLAHSGGGMTAHGDTIDVKIKGIWVGASSTDKQKVFTGPGDGPVTVTATPDQWMTIDIEVQLTTTDSFWDNINPLSENWPDIKEVVLWNDFLSKHFYRSPTDTIPVTVGMKVSDILKLDGVPDDKLYIFAQGWFGAASLQDSHTVYDEAVIIVQPPSRPVPPTLTLTANPMSITSGQSTTVSWSSANTTSCTGSRGGSYPTSGSFVHTPPSLPYTYGMTCTGPGGSVTQSATVSQKAASPPVVSLTSSSSSITQGQSATLGWGTSNATSCTGSASPSDSNWSGNITPVVGGNRTVTPNQTTTYTLSCSGPGGQASDSVTVQVRYAGGGPFVDIKGE